MPAPGVPGSGPWRQISEMLGRAVLPGEVMEM